MKSIVAKNTWFDDSNLRLDASYHLSEGNLYKLHIIKSPLGIGYVSDFSIRIFYGGRAKRNYVLDGNNGVAFLGSSDMLKSDFTNVKFISKIHTINLNDSLLKENWILISRSGTVGNTVFTNKDFLNKAASEHIIRVIPNNKIKSGFLYAYLSSKYGYSLLTQGIFGAVIQHIEPDHIAKIPVPIFSTEKQETIHKFIVQAAELRVRANKMFEEIISQIEDKCIVSSKERYYYVSIKNVLQGDKYTNESRIEADFYQPQAGSLIKEIKKQDWAFLGDITNEIQRSGLRERRFVKTGIPLITGQSLNVNKLRGIKMLSQKFTRNIEKNTTKENDILISVQGTIGKIEYSYNNIYQGVFASEQLTKVSVKRELVHPGYIYAFLKSKLGQIQLQKYKTGSVIEWIIENNIASIVVPIPSDKGLNIGNKVDKLTLMRQDAYNYEATAIQLIETEITQWQQ